MKTKIFCGFFILSALIILLCSCQSWTGTEDPNMSDTSTQALTQNAEHEIKEMQARVLTEQIVTFVMTEDWLNREYALSETDYFRFLNSLSLYMEDTEHPFSKYVRRSEEKSADLISAVDVRQILADLFDDKEFVSSAYYANNFGDSNADFYVPLGIGLWTSPFEASDMTTEMIEDTILVRCTLAETSLYETNGRIYGKCEFRYIADPTLRFVGFEYYG